MRPGLQSELALHDAPRPGIAEGVGGAVCVAVALGVTDAIALGAADAVAVAVTTADADGIGSAEPVVVADVVGLVDVGVASSFWHATRSGDAAR